MPVGRRELERWSRQQQAQVTVSGGQIANKIRSAHTSGTLNLTGEALEGVPPELLNWHAPIGDENWWEIVELRKLDLSHNSFSTIPNELFLPLSELQTLHVGNNKLNALPASLATCSATLQRVNLQRNSFSSLPPALSECIQLVFLNADHNALDVLPDFVGGLIHLETLSVAHNRLRAVPESIGNCQRLTTVILASNDLTTLPAGLGRLGSLTELELGHNRLERLPESLANLSLLVRLDCRENKLNLPPTIPRSARLAELLLGFNRLSALPSGLGLGAAPALSVLDVRDNGICELEMAALLRLRHLKTLDLRNNSVGKLPPLLGTMTCITSLLLEGNPLKTMRRALIVAPAREILEYLRGRMTEDDRAVLAAAASDVAGKGCCDTGTGDSGRDQVMAAVRGAMSLDASLVMRQMHLTRLPDEASSLTNLRAADLSQNQLAGLPSWVPDAWAGTLQTMDLSHNCLGHGAGGGSLDALAGLENLTSLSLQRNRLKVLPAVLAALSKLQMLDLSQNEISTLADVRGAWLSDAWPRMHTLVMRHNALAVLPDELFQGNAMRKGLVNLDVSCNQLRQLPAGHLLAGMSALASLNLENNALTALDPALGSLELRALLVSGNPLKLIPRAVLEGGTQRLLSLLRDRMSEPHVRGRGVSQGRDVDEGRTGNARTEGVEDGRGRATQGSLAGREAKEESAAPRSQQLNAPDDGSSENGQVRVRGATEVVMGMRSGGDTSSSAVSGGLVGRVDRGVVSHVGRGEERPVGGGASARQGADDLQAILGSCLANISTLEDELQSSSLSQAKVFALKKKIAMERAAKIRVERALAQAAQ